MAKNNLVPIKVILKKRASNGQIDWPDMNVASSAIRNGMGWSDFVDTYGSGWFYDKVENLGTGADSGCACTLVPKNFAQAVSTEYPDIISMIDEAAFEKFYDERALVKMETEFLDTEVLQGILARKQLEDLGIAPAPSAEIVALRTKCLDPEDQMHRGIRKNLRKKWSTAKSDLKITIDPSVAKR